MALSGTLVSLATVVAIYALLAMGLNIKFGYGGLLDIGHVTFFLVGAYATALLVLPAAEASGTATYVLGLNWPWVAAIAVGIVVAGIAGVLIALPAIRLREDYLAITVLGFSEIARRLIQTQGWLANGPRSLRGWSQPLRDAFPLPGSTSTAVEFVGVSVPAFNYVLFGAVVAVFWAAATYALASRLSFAVETTRDRAIHAVWALVTLGAGYAGARIAARTEGPPSLGPVVGVGAVAGAAATGLALAGLGQFGGLVLVGAVSLFTWLFAVLLVDRRYAALTRRDHLAAVGVTTAFAAALLPLILFGGGDDAASSVALIVTVALLGGFLYGLYRVGSSWDSLGGDSEFVSVVGVAALWLFVLRYFGLSIVEPLQQTGVAGVVDTTLQNLLWLLTFDATGLEFDYARFVLALAVAAAGGTYVLLQRAVRSPFGRVLKSIREDEDVATALGKSTFSYKIQSMFLGSAVAGLAGGLWALSTGALVHTQFAPRITFVIFLMVIIGGTANNRGVILGSVIFWAFQRGTSDLAGFFPTAARSSVQALRLAFIGALLIVILYYRPEGIWAERKKTSPEVND